MQGRGWSYMAIGGSYLTPMYFLGFIEKQRWRKGRSDSQAQQTGFERPLSCHVLSVMMMWNKLFMTALNTSEPVPSPELSQQLC